jgi:hypothetical protein
LIQFLKPPFMVSNMIAEGIVPNAEATIGMI